MDHWLSDAPSWLAPLRRRLQEAGGLELEWLGASDAMVDAGSLAEAWGEDRFIGSFGERCRERVARSTLLATLNEAMILFDPAAPDGLWLSLDMNMPPMLWIPLGDTAEGVLSALRADPNEPLPEPIAVRAYIGRADALGINGIADLEDRVVMDIPWLEGPQWGVFTLASDDPCTTMPRRVQNHGSVADLGGLAFTSSYRAAASNSVLTFEAHPYDVFLADIRYLPAPHGHIVADVAAMTGIAFPRDLPLDVVAALMSVGGFVPQDALQEGAVTPSPLRAQALLGLTAVAPRAPETSAALRAALLEPELQEAVAALTVTYGLDAVARDLLQVTTSADLRAWLQDSLLAFRDP